LEDEWTYFFSEGILESYIFSKYSRRDEVTEENFNKCLQATEKTIDAYTKKYGKPILVESEGKEFRDPAEDHHWGYDVLKAKWKTKDSWIVVEFDFFGGKAQYFFLVKIEVHKPGYEYF